MDRLYKCTDNQESDQYNKVDNNEATVYSPSDAGTPDVYDGSESGVEPDCAEWVFDSSEEPSDILFDLSDEQVSSYPD